MNINTKAVLVSTLLIALFAGTSAIAGDNDHFVDIAAAYNIESTTEIVVMQKVNFSVATVETGYEFESSNR